MRDFVETILTPAARIPRQSLEDVFAEWVKDIVQSAGVTTPLPDRWPSIDLCIDRFEVNFENASQALPYDPLYAVLEAAVCSAYPCLLENGDIAHCHYPRELQEGDESLMAVGAN